MTYTRQTSARGGMFLAVFLSGIFIIITLIMTRPVALFGFILNGGTSSRCSSGCRGIPGRRCAHAGPEWPQSKMRNLPISRCGKDAADIFPVGKLVEQALGIQYLQGVTLVTDADEQGARRMLFREWKKNIAIGLFYLAGSGALLALVLSGRILIFLA